MEHVAVIVGRSAVNLREDYGDDEPKASDLKSANQAQTSLAANRGTFQPTTFQGGFFLSIIQKIAAGHLLLKQ
jgi:hypothetical protein